jgi:hypothetical protein
MPRLEREKRDLASVDRHLAQCRARISRQEEIILRLDRHRRSTKLAEELLALLRQAETTLLDHRQVIVAVIGRLKAEGHDLPEADRALLLPASQPPLSSV